MHTMRNNRVPYASNVLWYTKSLLRQKNKYIYLIAILITVLVIGRLFSDLYAKNISLQSKNIYVGDDEPFQEYVNKNYNLIDLVEWEPAPLVPDDASKPGYLGKPVTVMIPKDLEGYAKDLEKYRINDVASKMVGVNRTLIDYRHKDCLKKQYPKKLPQTSVIIAFHNEEWFSLLRTVWSIYTTSPRALLKEIILVDDKSEFEELGKNLDEYIRKVPVHITIVRLAKRSGLTQAKLAGARAATGSVLTFIDAHCECNVGWLEPLLARIAEDRRAVVTPVCGYISQDNLEVKNDLDYKFIGAFDWRVWFTWLPVPPSEQAKLKADNTSLIHQPTMVGGLFAIDRELFFKFGGYDDDMTYYGGENVELSLRLWTCGSSVEMAMCSRVFHVTKNNKPYSVKGGFKGGFMTNTARVVDVWFDDYKKIYYALDPMALSLRTDVSKRLQLRKQLKCKSFSWYLRNIFTQSAYNRNLTILGSIQNVAYPSMCLDTLSRPVPGPIGVANCHSEAGNQIFMVTKNHEIRFDIYCLDATGPDKLVMFYMCHMLGYNQKFIYNKKHKTFVHSAHNINCLTLQPNMTVSITVCNASLPQQWELNDSRLKIDL